MRKPWRGELQVVLFVEDRPAIIYWMRADAIEARLAAVETYRDFTPVHRNDLETQMGGRLYAYEALTGANAETELVDHLGSEILWLAVHHYAQDGLIRNAIQECLGWHSYAVLSVTITSPAGHQPGTCWAIAVGSKPHDMREKLPTNGNSTVEFFGCVTDLGSLTEAS